MRSRCLACGQTREKAPGERKKPRGQTGNATPGITRGKISRLPARVLRSRPSAKLGQFRGLRRTPIARVLYHRPVDVLQHAQIRRRQPCRRFRTRSIHLGSQRPGKRHSRGETTLKHCARSLQLLLQSLRMTSHNNPYTWVKNAGRDRKLPADSSVAVTLQDGNAPSPVSVLGELM